MDMTREQLFPLSLSEKWRKKHVSKNGRSDPGLSCFREGVSRSDFRRLSFATELNSNVLHSEYETWMPAKTCFCLLKAIVERRAAACIQLYSYTLQAPVGKLNTRVFNKTCNSLFYAHYKTLEVLGPSRPGLLAGGPSDMLDFVLCVFFVKYNWQKPRNVCCIIWDSLIELKIMTMIPFHRPVLWN